MREQERTRIAREIHDELGSLHRLLVQTTNEVFSHHQAVLRILGGPTRPLSPSRPT